MAGVATNVTAGKPKTTGAVFAAPAGTNLPTSVSDTLNSAFKDLGFVSEDGVTESTSMSATNIKEWGGGVVLVTQDEKSQTVKFKLIEYKNSEVQKFVNGSGNVTVSNGAMAITVNDDDIGEQALVIDQVLRDSVPFRIVVPRGKITAIGDVVYKTNEAIGYDVTVQAIKDTSGNAMYKYMGGAQGATGATGATS